MMDEHLKERIVDYFTPTELVDLIMEKDDELFPDLVEFLRDRIEDNLDEVVEFMDYGA